MQKLFLFDFDGVVVDSLALYEDAVNRCLERLGKPPFKNREEFLEVFEENFYEGIARKGVDVSAFMKASAALAPTLDYGKVTPVRELEPVLEELRKEHLLFVISSNSNDAIRRILAQVGYDHYFQDVLGHEVRLSKIEKIRQALTALEKDPRDTYYIGDTVGDIREAKTAGVRTVAVTWGWHSREQLAQALPDCFIDQPEDLLKL